MVIIIIIITATATGTAERVKRLIGEPGVVFKKVGNLQVCT